MMKKKLAFGVLLTYCAVFYLLWAVREIVLLPLMLDALSPWAEAWAGAAIKLLVWTLPALCLIRFFREEMWIPLKTMLWNRVNWLPYLLIAGGFGLYYVAVVYIRFGRWGLSPDFEASSLIGTVLFVGVTEEIVFRGWLLNATLRKLQYWPAALSNAALFVLIHFPIWISRGQFTDPLAVLSNCAGIFVLSLLFSWAFVRSKNIFVPIMLHMAWNLCNVLLIGG